MPYYGASGDVRADLNGGLATTHNNYKGETQIGGELVTRARRWAYSLINSYLQPAYPDNVPWESGNEPEMIYEIGNLLSQYFVLSKKNLGNEPLDKKKVKELYDDPVKILEKLSTFEMELPEIDKPYGEKAYHTHKGNAPISDMDPITSHRLDPDRLEDIIDARD